MKIYRIYDDEWEAIYGSTQLKVFASQQVREHPDDFIEENGCYDNLDNKKKEKYKTHVKNFDTSTILQAGGFIDDIRFAKWVLDVRNYTIEEINVY